MDLPMIIITLAVFGLMIGNINHQAEAKRRLLQEKRQLAESNQRAVSALRSLAERMAIIVERDWADEHDREALATARAVLKEQQNENSD